MLKKFIVCILCCFLFLNACTNKEEKFKSYVSQAKNFLQKNELDKARIQLLNALKLNPNNSEVYYYLGEICLRKGDIRAAISNYLQAVRIDPKNTKANVRIGELLLKGGRYNDAKNFLQRAYKQRPEDLNIGKLYSWCLIGLKNNEEAEKVLAHLYKINPTDPEILILLGDLQLVKYNDSKKAEKYFIKAVKSDKAVFKNYYPLFTLYLKNKRLSDAEKVLLDGEKRFPDDPEVNIALSNYYLQLKKAKDAILQLKKAIKKDPKNPLYYKMLSIIYTFQYKDLKKAENSLKEAIDKCSDNPAAYINLATFYLSLKNGKKAEHILKEAMKKFPNYTIPMRILAQYYYEIKDIKKAEELYKKLLAKNRNDPLARLIKAKILLLKGKVNEAEEILIKLLKDMPNFDEAYFTKAILDSTQGRLNLAKEEVTKALEINPNHIKANLLMSEILIRESNYQEAKNYLEKAKKLSPTDVRIYINLGRIALLEKKYQEAEKNFTKVKELIPKNFVGYMYLANTYLREKKFDKALKEYRKVLQLNPYASDAISKIALIYLIKKENQRAINFCQDLLKNNKNKKIRAYIYYTLGKIYMIQKQYEEARTAFNKAIYENPNLMLPYLQLANLAIMNKDIDSAISYYHTLEKKAPENISVLMMLGVLYNKKNDIEHAKKYYEKCLKIKKDFAPAANNLAWLMAEYGENLDKALSLAQIAKEKMPDDPYVSDTLGWIYVKKNAILSGISQLEDAHKALLNNPTVTYHLAYAYYKNGEFKKAKKLLESIVKSENNFPEKEKCRNLLSKINLTSMNK